MEGRLVGGRYRLDTRIGSGAMGVVWLAHDERLRRAVAVKQLRLDSSLDADAAEEARQRAMREGRIAARLHHPNAITVFDVVDEDDAPWLVMEYLPSRSLATVIEQQGVLRPEEVGRIGAQVAHALAAAHTAGIVHRDIKPANVLLGDNGIVKITDFGISRATGDVAVTKTGLIAGTPAYLAPEVAYGRDPEAVSDVYSLGSTLYAAAEGTPPFGLSENTLALLHQVAAGHINPPKRSGILTDVLIALLNAEPERRPSAAMAAHWLDAVARGTRPDIPVVEPTGMTSVLAGPTAIMAEPTTTMAGSTMIGPPARMPTGVTPGSGASRHGLRSMLLAGIGVIAVAAVAAVLFFSHTPPTVNYTPDGGGSGVTGQNNAPAPGTPIIAQTIQSQSITPSSSASQTTTTSTSQTSVTQTTTRTTTTEPTTPTTTSTSTSTPPPPTTTTTTTNPKH